ncbi:hypothetical protein [Deinococcus hopiensis]|uniref:hypothetical protein n=1 Tax=Deinococcus hopiensis TaxID=309885 RepID=UPI0009FFD454|nr:hypothetical protein [Deinococcus hopiensis]
MTGSVQLRVVNNGAVRWETIGSVNGGSFVTVITPEQARRNSTYYDYARTELLRYRQADCKFNTLATSSLPSGGYWVQYLYVNGQEGFYRQKQERLAGDVYRTRNSVYIYAEGTADLTGSADCNVTTSSGSVRQVFQADVHLRPGWNMITTESDRLPDNHLEISVRMGDDPEVHWSGSQDQQ